MKEYKFKINGKEYNVAVNGIEGNIADVTVNGNNYSVEVENALGANSAGTACGSIAPSDAGASVSTPSVPLPGGRNEPASGPQNVNGTIVVSPLPGDVIEVSVKEGDAVRKGQKVAVIEAMKMENDILAECDGTIARVHVTKGDHVDDGANIVTIA